MAQAAKTDPNQKWLAANATAEEFNTAFRSFCETQWGLPTFSVIRLIVETRRALVTEVHTSMARTSFAA